MCFDHGLKQFALQVPAVSGRTVKYQNQTSHQKNQKDGNGINYTNYNKYNAFSNKLNFDYSNNPVINNKYNNNCYIKKRINGNDKFLLLILGSKEKLFFSFNIFSILTFLFIIS